MEMEENPELEEGEALDGGYNNNIMDPDIALSYIDEKIQHVLGHFQKDFEGGVSAENLGAKFGGYGSFLPTYERSPQRSSQPKTPQRNCSTQKSPNNLPVEGVSQSVKVPLNDAASIKLGISSGSSNVLHKSGLGSTNVPVKKQSSLFKKPHKSGRFSDPRSLKVRIKVGPDSVALKNAAIYSGLGLENSPSSSLGNSPEVSGGVPSQRTAGESPTSIVQVMTSFPVPGGAIVSPLHDNLLCLMKKERFSRDVKPIPIKGGQTNSALLAKESVPLVGNEKPSKKKGVKFPKKSEMRVAMKHESDINFGNGTTFPTKMKLENENPESKNVISNNFKSIPLLGTEHGDGTLKVTSRPTEVPMETDEDDVGGRIFSPDFMKEDSLESRSGQDSGKSEKRSARTQSGSVEKLPQLMELPYSNGVQLKGNKKSKKSKARAPSRAFSDASGNEEDLPRGLLAPSKAVQQAAFRVQDEFLISSAKDKPLSESKKLPSSKSSKQAVPHGSMEIGVNRESRDLTEATHGVSKSRDPVPKVRFPDSSKFRDNHKDHTKLEKKNSQKRSLERPSKWKDSTMDGFGMVRNASSDNPKQGFSGKQVDKQPMNSLIEDVASVGISPGGNALVSEVAPPVPASNPVYIEENWVCCDSCQTWRLLPQGTLPEHLPEKWLCSMLNWLPGMNRCDISEEETTKALNALYHVPLATGQNNLQIDTSKTTSGVQVQHVDHSLQSLNSLAVPTPAKKKHGLKEIAKAGMMQSSNSSNNHLQESVKSRSVNNMNQPPAEANLVNKSSVYTLSKSQNLVAEAKRSPLAGAAGITKQGKMKSKREADHFEYGNPKKTKTDLSDSDKKCNSDTGLGRTGLNSGSGLSIKVRGKDVLKSNECSFSGDVKCEKKERLLVSVKKLSDPPQVSSDGGSLNVGMSDKKNISIKKRKLKEWQDDQNGLQSTGNDEDSCGSGLKKVKKLKVSKSGAFIMNNTRREKLDKTEVVAHDLSSGSQDRAVQGVTAERRIHKDQRLQKHRGKFAQQQHLDATDSSRKDLGLGQLSTTATSSSSKVSGSLKTRTTLEDVKGSPVESVSSSPMRIPFSEKLGSTGGGILGKDDDAMNGDLPVVDGLRTHWDQKRDDQIHQSGTRKMEKLSGGPRFKSFKILPINYQDGDPKPKVHKTRRSSSQSLNGGGETVKQHKSPVDLFATKNCHGEVRTEKNLSENMLPLNKSGKGPSLQLKENDRSSISDFDRDQKLSEPGNAQVDILNKRTKKEAEVDLKSHTPLRKRANNVKHSIPDKPSNKFSKDEKVHVSRSSSASQFSKDGRMETPLKHDPDDPNNKLVSLDSRKRDTGPPRANLVPGFDNEIKVDSVQKELRPETSSLVPHAGLEAKHEKSARGSQQERASDVHFPNAPGNDLASKASIRPGSCGKMNGVQSVIDAKSVKDITASVPASSQTAVDVLEEAKTLRDYADRLKISGFSMESNEINFQAARKFLHGAFLLETCNEVGKQGEMTQIQAYSLTAKLCECSAVDYEGRREMAAAALAYKCLEVAHWRIVYCKSSGVIRDRNELQACLQTFSQGESPSSSASDIDNLNNQAIVDKATVPKSAISHVAGHPVIAARNTSSLFRVLDYTQDVANAWEASRKYQNSYIAANLGSNEARNKDCLVSVKKAIDFSFQDVKEFLHLVQQATEAITRAGPVSARE
ncbi:Cysteine-tryptophan domain-containing zinc finger protein 7 [Euphorbia peplus]|nr:Cysteine-tryptophan domain-containing zinc finger protein 7 [Euphorbia peplus]